MESLTTFLLAAKGKVKIEYSEIEFMIVRVLEQNPEELKMLKEWDLDEQSVLSIFEKNEIDQCCLAICLNFDANKRLHKKYIQPIFQKIIRNESEFTFEHTTQN